MVFSKFLALFSLAATLAIAPLVQAKKVRIVTTNTDLAAMARAVGGDDVKITAMAGRNQNPHDVDARPSNLVPLSRAHLVLLTGLKLEAGWLPPLLENARNPRILPGKPGYFKASQFVHIRDVPPPGTDRSQGDVHPGGNPHFSYDPRAMKAIALGLHDRLTKIRPDLAKRWTQNTARFVRALDALTHKESDRFAKLTTTQRQAVEYHESMAYLFDWLHITLVDSIEPMPQIPPTPAHTAKVLKDMRAHGVHVIIQEAYYPQSTTKTIARLAHAKIVTIPGGTNFPAETYIEHIQSITHDLYEAMSK